MAHSLINTLIEKQTQFLWPYILWGKEVHSYSEVSQPAATPPDESHTTN